MVLVALAEWKMLSKVADNRTLTMNMTLAMHAMNGTAQEGGFKLIVSELVGARGRKVCYAR